MMGQHTTQNDVEAIKITKATGKVEQLSLKNIWIARKQTDGGWKFWRIMSTRDPSLLGS